MYAPVAVGTPHRLHKLIELGALSLSKTQIILIDLIRDSKNLNMLTMNDVKNDLLDFLNVDVTSELNHIKIALIQ